MSVSLAIETEEKLAHEAIRQGLSTDQCASQLLDRQLLASEQQRREKLTALLQLWIDEDIAGSQEFDDEFVEVLDEDRLADRKLFPPELKGISW